MEQHASSIRSILGVPEEVSRRIANDSPSGAEGAQLSGEMKPENHREFEVFQVLFFFFRCFWKAF